MFRISISIGTSTESFVALAQNSKMLSLWDIICNMLVVLTMHQVLTRPHNSDHVPLLPLDTSHMQHSGARSHGNGALFNNYCVHLH